MAPQPQKQPAETQKRLAQTQKRERRLAALASRQHGVVGRKQLLALGLRPDAIKSRVASGRLHSIHRDAYAVGHRRLSQRGLWMAAVLGCGTGSLLSHHSAAALWGLEEARSPIDVTAPRGRQGSPRRAGVRLHRCQLEDTERTQRDGIPVTTVARTLFDLAEAAGPDPLSRLWEEADKLHLLVIDDVAEVYERRRGCRRARRRIRPLLLEAPRSERTRSPLEDRFVAFCRHFELPPPATNVLVLEKEVDAAWLDARLLVELDSWEHHAHRAAFERDRKRDIALIVAGYRTIRVTHRRLDREAATLAAEIRILLGAT
jgi:predicted transcriptional regulator of viral defense system